MRSSARLQRPSGTPRVAGSSQAIALHAVTTAAWKARGRPGRLRSPRPSKPSFQKRLRHLVTVLGASPSLRAIARLVHPAAASSTILALVTCHHPPATGRPRRVGRGGRLPGRGQARSAKMNRCPRRSPSRPRPRSASGCGPASGSAGRRWPASRRASGAPSPMWTANSTPASCSRCAGCAMPARPACGVRHSPGQHQRLPGLVATKRPPGRHTRGSPGLRPRALPR